MFDRKKIAIGLAEFLGTGTLTLVLLSVTHSSVGIPYFIGVAGGVAVAALVLAFGAVSGAHLNPALTIGLWTGRRVKTLPAIAYIALQLAGAAVAYWLYIYIMNTHSWANVNKNSTRVMVEEVVGMFVFTTGWIAAVRHKYETGRWAAIAGLAFALGLIVASSDWNGVTNTAVGFINPAVALGARQWAWLTYVLGPIVGAVVAVNLWDFFMGGTDKVAVASSTSASSTSAANGSSTRSRSTTRRSSTRGRRTTSRSSTRTRRTR